MAEEKLDEYLHYRTSYNKNFTMTNRAKLNFIYGVEFWLF